MKYDACIKKSVKYIEDNLDKKIKLEELAGKVYLSKYHFHRIFHAGMAIYDTMQYIKSDVSTICVGMAASMVSFLLAAGTPGKRFALPNSEILIHQPSVYGGFQGQATDIKIHADWLLKTKTKINKIYSEKTGKPIEKVEADMERDFFMSAEETRDYGLIDNILIR